jgi:DUF4097 and DUF4098 domain-containing protein YvlB
VSSEERDMILQMVAEGKVSTHEAADLLDALDTEEESANPEAADDVSNVDMFRRQRDESRRERDQRRGRGLADRSLLIDVRDGEQTKTHVQIPLAMAAAAGKFIPKKAREYFEEYGIDLSDLIDSFSNDPVRRGEIVNVVDGETRVHIAIT